MLRNMRFVTELNGGDRHVTIEVDRHVDELYKFLEHRYDDPFKPRQNAYRVIKDIVHHIVHQSNDSLLTICQRYSKTTAEYLSLLPYVARFDNEFRSALNELAGSENVLGEVRFSEETEFMIIQVFTLETHHGQTRFDRYIDHLRAEGQFVPREVDKLLSDWKSTNEKFHFRHPGTEDRQSLGRGFDFPRLID